MTHSKQSHGWEYLLPPFFIFLYLLTLLGACRPADPIEAVHKIRRDYEVKLNGWQFKEDILYLDIIVMHTSDRSLPGISAELYHFDAENRQKAMIPIYIESSQISDGQTSQITIPVTGLTVLEDEGFGMKYFKYPTDRQIQSYREYKECQP